MENLNKLNNKIIINTYILVFLLSLAIFTLLIHPASAIITITNTSTENSINWQWTTNETIANLTIDGYKVCSFDTSATTFVLTDLDASTSHEIVLKSLEDTTAKQTTETKENIVDFLLKYYIIQIIGFLLILVSLTNRVVILSLFGLAIIAVGFILTLPESVSSYYYILLNGLLLLFGIIITALEVKAQ